MLAKRLYKLFFFLVFFIGVIEYICCNSFSKERENRVIKIDNNKVSQQEKKNVLSPQKEKKNDTNNLSFTKIESNNADCFIKFENDKYLNPNIDGISYYDLHILEDENKFKICYKTFMIQNDPITKQKEINKNEAEYVIKQNNVKLSTQLVKLTSLVYFDDKHWNCKINNKTFNYNTQNTVHKNVSIVKVNKQSILFVLNNTTEDIINKVVDIKKKKKQYYTNFYIVSNGGKKVFMFRLFTGQTIDLQTLKISG